MDWSLNVLLMEDADSEAQCLLSEPRHCKPVRSERNMAALSFLLVLPLLFVSRLPTPTTVAFIQTTHLFRCKKLCRTLVLSVNSIFKKVETNRIKQTILL